MRLEDLLEQLRRRPFVPFRIHMTDGRFYDIVHPEAVLVLRSRAIIGLRPDPTTNIPDQSEQIALLHVVRTSEIPADSRQPAHGTAG
ncbi:MAG: hypothetical protein ABSH35_11690 [Isosphaeraceae bacterium]